MARQSFPHEEPSLMVDDGTGRGSGLALALTGGLLVAGIFLVNAPWAGYHGIFFLVMGLLMALFPPPARLPRVWWLLAALACLASFAPYLPAAWFPQPAWRNEFESLGIPTGNLVTIQWRQALETHATLLMIPLGALWLAGHRATGGSVRPLALIFVCAIAAYAIVSKLIQGEPIHGSGSGAERFGILPNRNHSALLLSMGVVAGLGCIVQAIREHRWFSLAVALLATMVCAWAAAVWSISRAGILLAALGAALWLPLMGWTYLGRNGRWAVLLLVIAFAGAFALTETTVKDRIAKTIASPLLVEGKGNGQQEKDLKEALLDKDFRVPTVLDTLDLIREHPWTGVGAGQFRYIFPQYRVRSAVHNDSQHFHPESDWLWLVAEFGIVPAVLLLLAVALALIFAARGVMKGRDRALRAACLAAAALLPIHAGIDVPGHRIALALAAAWLFALALHAPRPEDAALANSDQEPRLAWRRLWALPVLVVAGWMIWLQGGGNGGARTTAAEQADKAVAKWMEIDKEAREKASEEGKFFDPPEAEDPLVKALAVLERAISTVPLDRSLRRQQGVIALYFDNRYDLVRSAFATERGLDPSWVACAVEQSQIWACALPEESEKLWNIAMERARKIEERTNGSRAGPGPTWERLRMVVIREPALKPRWDEWSVKNPKPQ